MYFIIETQVNAEGVGSALVSTREDRNAAESEYHRILQFAAISEIPHHGAIIIDEECIPILHKAYEHTEEEEE